VLLAGGDRSRSGFHRLQIVGWLCDFRFGFYSAYFRNKKPITPFWDGLDESGSFGVIAERLPELADSHAEAAVEINEGIAGPEAASKFLAADDFSGAFEKHEKQPKGLLLQLDAFPVLQELRRGGVYLKRAESIDGSWKCLHTLAPRAVKDR
jgi:hypothetical protein